MNLKTRNIIRRSILLTVGGLVGPAFGATVVEYDASTGLTPDELPNPWTLYGAPMFNTGNVLLQDNTFDDPTTESGEYLSPSTPGLMNLTTGQYGIDTVVRPLTDVPFLGSSNYANAYITWSDDQYSYNITIDKYTNDQNGTGGIKYGQNSMSDAVTGIDWSVPHDIYIGYRASAPYGVFDFYVDGVLKSTISAGSMARTANFPFAQNAVDFGDGTTGQGQDVAVEWYDVKILDSATPVVPPTEWNVDASGNWSTASNWTNGVPDSIQGIGTAIFGSKIQSPQTVTLDAPHGIGHVVFDNANSYTIAGTNTLQFTTPGNASIDVLQGNHTISTPVSMTSNTVITVASGSSLTLSGPTISIGTNATATKTGPGSLAMTNIRGYRLDVDQGTATIIQGATANSAAGASNLNSLVIAGGDTPTAQLDITNNTLVIDYTGGSSPIADVAAQIASGYAGGAWNGNGIMSSTAAGITGVNKTAVGYAEASQLYGAGPYPTVSGQTIDGDTLLIRYVYAGDSNLDGKVNALDFNALATNYGTTGTGWIAGDFNYDGTVDSRDFSLLAMNYGQTLAMPAALPAMSLVPEPTTLLSTSVLSVFASLGFRRRRGA